MESKIKEYQDLYSEFINYRTEAAKTEGPVKELEQGVRNLISRQNQVDYHDADIVAGYMETYIKNMTSREEKKIRDEINSQIAQCSNSAVAKNLEKISKWIPEKKITKLLTREPFNPEQEMDVQKAEKMTGFSITSILNKVMGMIFRFDFLVFLPRVLRILASIIFWGFLLVPKLVSAAYYRFETKYPGYLLKWAENENEYEGIEIIKKELIYAGIRDIVLAVLLIIFINLIVYFAALYFARKYLLDHRMECLSVTDPVGLAEKLYDYRVTVFREKTVSKWRAEADMVKSKGVNGMSMQTAGGEESVYQSVKAYLQEKYRNLETEIRERKERISSIGRDAYDFECRIEVLIPQLLEKEKEVKGFIGDSNYNQGILSSYVAAGFSKDSIEGINRLIAFRHNCKPMLFFYSDESADNGEKFREDIANMIERLMEGFFQENYHGNINMWLVDFEGLHFPESRTKGLMKVVRTQQGLQELYTELGNTRTLVDSLADGKITSVNPDRLSRRENPIKYNIVYFVGVDFAVIDKEINQLFISGENFGFLPVIFMRKSVVQAFYDDSSPKTFLRVLQKIGDSGQMYHYEGILAQFGQA